MTSDASANLAVALRQLFLRHLLVALVHGELRHRIYGAWDSSSPVFSSPSISAAFGFSRFAMQLVAAGPSFVPCRRRFDWPGLPMDWMTLRFHPILQMRTTAIERIDT